MGRQAGNAGSLEPREENGMRPEVSAAKAELRYISENIPGYQRKRRGKGFCYIDPEGCLVKDSRFIARFRQLRIPPAWEKVWICPRLDCHIQATGRDARGRKQYLYHPRWSEIRNLTKFDRLLVFAHALPVIRERVDQDLRRAPFSRETVLAFVVSLLEQTLVRIGNTEYLRQNESYGLTTLRDYHVRVSGSLVNLRFRGKRGKLQEVDFSDRRLARLARKYQELPGQELLKYQDGPDEFKVIESEDVNQYLREISGENFTAKDFRTWGATVFATAELYRLGPASSVRESKRRVSQAIKGTASKLGNTPAICRKYYVDPRITEAYVSGELLKVMDKMNRQDADGRYGLSPEERAVVILLNGSKPSPIS